MGAGRPSNPYSEARRRDGVIIRSIKENTYGFLGDTVCRALVLGRFASPPVEKGRFMGISP